jgi:hypothetical protein
VAAGVTGTAADQSSVLVNSASVSSGPKLAPAAIIGIVVVRALCLSAKECYPTKGAWGMTGVE